MAESITQHSNNCHSQSLGIVSGPENEFSPSLSYSAHKLFNTNHNMSTVQNKTHYCCGTKQTHYWCGWMGGWVAGRRGGVITGDRTTTTNSFLAGEKRNPGKGKRNHGRGESQSWQGENAILAGGKRNHGRRETQSRQGENAILVRENAIMAGGNHNPGRGKRDPGRGAQSWSGKTQSW